jgi:hypothetical protein
VPGLLSRTVPDTHWPGISRPFEIVGRPVRSEVIMNAAPPPPPPRDLLGVFPFVGRGTVLHLRSDAPVDAHPPYLMRVVAVSRARRPGALPGVRPVPVTASFPLDQIPRTSAPFPVNKPIRAERKTVVAPHEYNVLVRLTAPFDVSVTMESPHRCSPRGSHRGAVRGGLSWASGVR